MKLLDKTIAIYGAIGFSVAVSYFTLVATGVPVENLKIYFVSTTALFVALLSLFNYFGLLCVVLALLPFSLAFLNVEVGIITFSPYVLGITILVILSVVSLHIKKIKFGFNLTDFLIGLLCLEYLITTFLSENIIESGHLAFHAIFVPVVSYFVVKWMVRTETEYHKAMVFLIWGIIIFSIFAMFQFIVTKERVVLLGVEPIGVATFAITGFLVIAYSNLRKNWVGLPAMLVTLGALVASLSRLYLVSVALAPFFIRYIRKGRALHLMLLMIVLSLAATIFFPTILTVLNPKALMLEQKAQLTGLLPKTIGKDLYIHEHSIIERL